MNPEFECDMSKVLLTAEGCDQIENANTSTFTNLRSAKDCCSGSYPGCIKGKMAAQDATGRCDVHCTDFYRVSGMHQKDSAMAPDEVPEATGNKRTRASDRMRRKDLKAGQVTRTGRVSGVIGTIQ